MFFSKKYILYLRLLRPIFHILLILLSFWIVYNIRFYDFVENIFLDLPDIIFNETLIFTLISSFLFILIGFLFSIYEIFKPIHGYYKEFLKIRFFWMIIISFIAYLGQGFIFPNGISRFILLIGGFFSLLFITIFDILLNNINSYLERKNPYKLLFIYSTESFYKKIFNSFSDYKIYDITGIYVDDLLDLNKEIKKYDIFVTVGNFDKNFLQNLMDIIRLYNKQFYHISENFFLEDLVYSSSRIGPVLAYEQKPSPLDGWFKVTKRITDILFSILFITIFSWLYILISIFIFIKDGRPIFYKSERIARGGRKFFMYKFRTMIKDADKQKQKLIKQNERKGPLFKISNDPRIPKWGKILRKTSLDEIPQFLNVIKGDMSVVGPRPHLDFEVEKYEKWQKRLLSVKPGITGYAQIFGRDNLDFDEEAKLDLYYIQNWSLFLDVFVIISTIKVVFSGR
ncbi:sugar transferase [Candidatus Vampirococcus lugosii]|uniref:Undecaprenyl-phosphate galactosephosphotransferase n=1 Tax=Candidatus Vampirococcus lugosii TaxID=2789015 RepID=A0ABS5QLS7_9BACT|nr:exopolysaccharide biosynthesis polyprenyl glycosylphosphotransferase [Candidatus Vampirococcus lugosii]MBS8121671.1 Undecaprenyl-phosphate galactosephosphotransferase [Candidatus Vampirococcus lugosii]